MFWKRTHAQKQRQLARPSFRPVLEQLEDRQLLSASAGIPAGDPSAAQSSSLQLLQEELGRAQWDLALMFNGGMNYIGGTLSGNPALKQLGSIEMKQGANDITKIVDQSAQNPVGIPTQQAALAQYLNEAKTFIETEVNKVESFVTNYINSILSRFSFSQPAPTSPSRPTPSPKPPPFPAPHPTNYSGTISGSFTSDGGVDQEGRGFFGSNLGGKGNMTATPSSYGGYDVSGSFQLTQAQPDFLGPDNLAGNYGFSFHVASLSGSVFFDASGSDVTLACTGGFSSNGSFGGSWVLVAGDQDDSDNGNGNFSLN